MLRTSTYPKTLTRIGRGFWYIHGKAHGRFWLSFDTFIKVSAFLAEL